MLELALVVYSLRFIKHSHCIVLILPEVSDSALNSVLWFTLKGAET